MFRRLTFFTLVILTLILIAAPSSSAQQIDPDLLSGLRARSIGPAAMSGRVAAVDAVISDPKIIYVGASTGGVWKSVNAGITWTPIFDDQPVNSIGAIAINQTNPDIVWVGTGEGNVRNSASIGNGVYKSTDGGRTWKHLGLEATERIPRIVLHPTNPDVAFVAALGREWGENPERGVFKTTDGGKTWQKILYVDEKTGAAEIAMHPSNPEKLLVNMWQYRRWPWFFYSGGPGSGLFLTSDGGTNWKKLSPEDGLPKGDLGRIGLSIARSQPDTMYALVEAQNNALYRSDDGGHSWRAVNSEINVNPRPFYFADIHVDPERPDRLYQIAVIVNVSNDGGKSFELLVPFASIHPDYHAMWINPRDPEHIIVGNDGGVAISRDRGNTWLFGFNLPLAQFYHVRVDNDLPYNIYGGLQDNGSWRGPSSVWENGGIRNHHWREVAFGDGFDTSPDPEDSLRGYAMSQEGYIVRWNLRTGERKDIRPSYRDVMDLRFNWNAAFAQDPFEPATIYYGSQFVHKSTDRGESWSLLSGDLTTNNPEWQEQSKSGGLTPDATGAENFTTIISIAPSPVQRGLIWVGTDDGRIHVTRDGGKTWTSVEQNMKGVPANTYVHRIFPSLTDPGTVFSALDNHRRSDFTPYIFRTDDFGATWTNLATPDVQGYALSAFQDPVNKNLLFLGTEFGLYVSFDAGKKWSRWNHGVPTSSVMAMAFQPRENDLILGTHGRALYVLDDIRPLRTVTPEVLAEPVHIFAVPDAQQYRVRQTDGERFPGHIEFRGENRPYGALITFSLNSPALPHPNNKTYRAQREVARTAQRAKLAALPVYYQAGEDKPAEFEQLMSEERGPEVEIRIADVAGKTIRTFKRPAKLGLNRISWDLRADNFRQPSTGDDFGFGPGAPEVLPGTYKVTVKFGEAEASTSVRVVSDPRFNITDAARKAKWDAIQRAGKLREVVAEAVSRIRTTQADIDAALARFKATADKAKLTGAPNADSLKAASNKLNAAAKPLQKALIAQDRLFWANPRTTKGYVADTHALSRISYVLGALGSSWDAPTPAQLDYLMQAERALAALLPAYNSLFSTQLPTFRKELESAGIALPPSLPALEMPK